MLEPELNDVTEELTRGRGVGTSHYAPVPLQPTLRSKYGSVVIEIPLGLSLP